MTPSAAPAGALVAVLTLASTVALHTATTATRGAGVRRRLSPPPAEPAGVAWAASPPPAVGRRLSDAGVGPAQQGRLWSAWLAAMALVVPMATMGGGPGLALVAGAGVVAVPAAVLVAGAGRADRLLESALPEALEAMARSLRSSASLRQAIEEAADATPGPLGGDLAGVALDAANGMALADALDWWAERRPLAGVRLAVSALALGAEAGGAHAGAVDGVAATIRSRLAVGREIRALSSQARLSAIVITLAPLGFSALAAATDERTADFLLRTPFGLICLTVGLVLDGLAALWMHRLSRID